jgi:NADH-quinone oxidoreductase chain G
MIKVTVDGTNVFIERGSTVLQACEAIGIEIPRFCYHERLSVAGNCRMCLVEIEKTPKPVASCAMPTMDGMKIFTNTPLVKKAREAVLEFLSLNHPLDCPICDQGGECDLQDQAMLFGSDRSRFYETKRGVEDKNCGPLIKTIMTRCIHCTRCVRFATEIAGVEELGTTGRGRETEIGTYVEKTFKSELSGNIIDLCPVGALTSKPYAFMSRPWELRSTNSIDISDGVGSNIRIDSRGTEILRILPRFNESINEEWISDKARFSYDGLRLQRIESPYIRKDGQLVPTHWSEAFEVIGKQLWKSLNNTSTKPRILGLISESIDLKSALILKRWFQLLGANFDLKTALDNDVKCNLPVNYLQNTPIASIENSDLCLLVGVDPRYEASLLNVRLRKRYLEGGFSVASVGSPLNLTFPCQQLGLGKETFIDICEGYHPFSKQLALSQKPIIIIG